MQGMQAGMQAGRQEGRQAGRQAPQLVSKDHRSDQDSSL